jgi:hypothetical protein
MQTTGMDRHLTKEPAWPDVKAGILSRHRKP